MGCEPFQLLLVQNRLVTMLLVVWCFSPVQVPVIGGQTAAVSSCHHLSSRNVRILFEHHAAVKQQYVFKRVVFVVVGQKYEHEVCSAAMAITSHK